MTLQYLLCLGLRLCVLVLVAFSTSLGVCSETAPLVQKAPPRVQEKNERPPNVVLIISDDQAWTDFGFMGHPTIQTPNLDRLASESATFTRGYVPTALCRPSLTTIISGLYAHQHKTSGNDPLTAEGRVLRRTDASYLALCKRLIQHIDTVPTLPKLLSAKGYLSFQSGKWWEGNFCRGGFTSGMTHGDPARGGRHGDVGLTIGRKGLQPVFDFIQSAGAKPFFVWYAPFLPHTPHNPPKRLLDKYTVDGRPAELARYFAMCDWFDETCGELLGYLDKEQLTDNTIVCFVTDNGWIQHTPQTDSPPDWKRGFAPRSKQSPYEGGVRTPIMIRWPGHIPARRHESLVSSIDLAPTILAACDVEAPAEMHGINLLDVCRDRPSSRQAIFGESFAHDIADIDDPKRSLLNVWCIEGQWKLLLSHEGSLNRYRDVHGSRPRAAQLFDLIADPHETVNQAKLHPDVVERLTKRIEAWWPEAM